jgi:hypothetical protein
MDVFAWRKSPMHKQPQAIGGAMGCVMFWFNCGTTQTGDAYNRPSNNSTAVTMWIGPALLAALRRSKSLASP